MTKLYGELNPPPRILMGPGPVGLDPRVLRAMSMPMLGQFDPAFTAYMNEMMELLRQVRSDVARAEEDPYTRGLRDRAIEHIDEAIHATDRAIADKRFFGDRDRDHDRDHDRDRDRDRDR